MKKHVLVVCFSFFINTLFSQENKQELVWFDNFVSQQNLPINQGVKYSKKYKTFKGNHHFLFANKFQKGNLKYNNQMYYNVSMKYDTYHDNLILKINSKSEDFSVILNKELISYFEINNKKFDNINSLGFYEILYKTDHITLVRKFSSKKKDIKKSLFLYSKFTLEETLLLLKNNTFYTVKNRKHFHKIFPNKKNLVNDFFKMNKEKQSATFIINLIKKLNNE